MCITFTCMFNFINRIEQFLKGMNTLYITRLHKTYAIKTKVGHTKSTVIFSSQNGLMDYRFVKFISTCCIRIHMNIFSSSFYKTKGKNL